MPTLHEVFCAINAERAYQDQVAWTPATTSTGGRHSPTEFLLFMQDYAGEARSLLTRQGEPQASHRALHAVRKIAALAIACIEQAESHDPTQPRDYDELILCPRNSMAGRGNHTTAEFVVYLIQHIGYAMDAAAGDRGASGAVILEMVREIAWIAVACMAQTGVVHRGQMPLPE